MTKTEISKCLFCGVVVALAVWGFVVAAFAY